MPTIHDEGEEEEEADGPKEGQKCNVSPADAASAAAGGDAAGEIAAAEAPPAGVQPSGTDMKNETPNSYLVNLQPTQGTDFHRVIYQLRKETADRFGTDPTHLYPLHVSVTGFFEAYDSQVEPLIKAMRELLKQSCEGQRAVTLGQVICTKTGYVLFDMQAESITAFSQCLGERSSRELGVHIRPKAVNHISLACNRPDEAVRDQIKAMYDCRPGDSGGPERSDIYRRAAFDLVLSRLRRTVRTSSKRLPG